MKTPRDILLARHQTVDAKLDEIRHEAVAGLAARPVSESKMPFVLKLWRELIWPCRRTWTGLAAAWLMLALFNLSQSNHNQVVTAQSSTSPGEMRLAYQEQRRVLAEIIGPSFSFSPTEPPRRPSHQPRSQLRSVATA